MTLDSDSKSPSAYLLFLLNTHQPFVRHPEFEHSLEENWLHEAITESYIPLLDRIDGMVRDGIVAPLTFALTPTLVSMFDDNLRRRRYLAWVEERLGFLEMEFRRLRERPDLAAVARMHRRRLERCQRLFTDMWHGDLTGAFRRLQNSGAITLLPSAATHAYLPLWNLFPEIVELQIRVGLRWHEHCFGVKSKGCWLPECGYYPGLDRILARNGVRYFFVDAHGVLNGRPRPVRGTSAPVHTPAGLAAFPRDLAAHRQVWVESEGYPGDPDYMNRRRDASFECNLASAPPIAAELRRYPCGIGYWSGRDAARPYDAGVAYARCMEHARDFVSKCNSHARAVGRANGRPPLIAAFYDTEHFGHWWFEGPIWLDQTLRLLAGRDASPRLVAPEDYLREHPVNQVVEPTTSSWGYQGYSEVWLMGRNHWIYPPLFAAAEWLRTVARRGPLQHGWECALLNRYLREFMLAQSSDWAFLMHSEPRQTYAGTRVEGHLRNLDQLRMAMESGSPASDLIEHLDQHTPLFPGLDVVAEYRACVAH